MAGKIWRRHGWQQTDADSAQNMAKDGLPTIALWKNEKGEHGHIAIVRPGSVDARGPAVAQAGALVLDATHVNKGFHDQNLQKAIQYWYHK